MDFLLLKTQRNDVFVALHEQGLETAEFEWLKKSLDRGAMGGPSAGVVSVLQHVPTGYSFQFDVRGSSGNYWATYRPGRGAPQTDQACSDWPDMRGRVAQWAESVKTELEAPDLWATVAKSRVLPAAAAAEENTAFTEEEKARLNTALVEIKQYFSTGQYFSPQQKQYFDAQFEYLHGAIDRLGKKDWLHTAVGVIFSAVIGFGLSDHATPLLQFASDQISQAYGWSKEVIQKLLS